MKRKVNYSGTLIFNHKEKNLLQPIYGSQSYGTYYGIFANFFVSKQNIKDPKKVRLDKIELELINYSGTVDMSLEKVDLKIVPIKGQNKQMGIYMKIYVKAAAIIRPRLNLDLTLNQLKDDLGNIPFKDDSSRIINTNDILHVKRELLSLYGKTENEMQPYKKANNESTLGGIFDTEFFYRTGKNNVKKKRRLKSLNGKIKLLNGKTPLDYTLQLSGGLSHECMTGTAYIQVI